MAFVPKMGQKMFKSVWINPRTDGGGRISAPPWDFFLNSRKTAARRAAKFCMTIHLSILRDVCGRWTPTFQGQVARSLEVTRRRHFLRLCRCARAAGDDRTFWNSEDLIRYYKVTESL